MKIKNLLLLICILATGYATHSNAHFYGALVMQNPHTNKTVILLADFHISESLAVAPTDELALAQTQQSEVIALVKELEYQGEKVHVVIEDGENFLKNENNIIPGYGKQCYSPLWCLDQLCRSNTIACTDVEFRGALNQDEIQSHIRNNIDAGTLQKLYHYRSVISTGVNNQHADLDAAIINTIQTNESSSTILVCAGANHISSVSRILYQQGYTKIHIKTVEHSASGWNSRLYDFAKDEPMPEDPQEIPSHFPDIINIVLDTITVLRQQTEEEQKLKTLISQLYAASILFS